MGDDRELRASLERVHAASRRGDAHRAYLDCCGRTVSVEFGCPETEALLRPAFRPWESGDPVPASDLEIRCFVGNRPPQDWLRQNGLSTARNKTHQLATFRYCFQGHTLFANDAGGSRAWYWVEATEAFALYRARPLTRILAWFAEARGLMWIHAACIGSLHGAVLIPAAGGSGKSTAAVAGLLGGMHFLGDDFCVLDPLRLEVGGLYRTVVLSSASAALLQGVAPLDGLVSPFPEKKNKTCYYLDGRFDAQLPGRLPLRGILVPQISAGETAVERVEQGVALRAFVSSLQIGSLLGVDPATMLRDAYGVVRQVKVGRLLLGRDLARVAAIVDAFLQEH